MADAELVKVTTAQRDDVKTFKLVATAGSRKSWVR